MLCFQLVFEAVRGTNYRGDIAIDDIRVSTSPCGAATSGKKISQKAVLSYVL